MQVIILQNYLLLNTAIESFLPVASPDLLRSALLRSKAGHLKQHVVKKL